MIKLDTIKVLVSKVLIDLHVTHDECNSINNVMKEKRKYNEKKEKLKSSENTVEYTI